MRRLLGGILSLGLFTLVGLMAYLYYPENHYALEYQAQADCRRRQDIQRVAGLIERHFERTGRHPLDDGSGRSLSVVLTAEELPRQFKVNPPPDIGGVLVPAAELKAALEQTLGEVVTLPADPQTAFAWGSRYYLYRLDGGDYLLSAALYAATPHTLEQTRHRHLYRIGSSASASERVRTHAQIDPSEIDCASM